MGIAGTPGSGKSTAAFQVAQEINKLAKEAHSAPAIVVQMDGEPSSAVYTRHRPCGQCCRRSTSLNITRCSYLVAHAGQQLCQAETRPRLCLPGFHLYRRQLDVMPDPKQAYARRGAHWTFDAHRFLQAVKSLRQIGARHWLSLATALLVYLHTGRFLLSATHGNQQWVPSLGSWDAAFE